MAEITVTLRDGLGNARVGWTVQVRSSDGVSIISTTANGSVVDNGNGSYVTNNAPPAGVYDIYACVAGGTPALISGYNNIHHVEFPLPESLGGTGASDLSTLSAALGLEIGVDVQEHSVYFDQMSTSLDILHGLDVDGIAAYDHSSNAAAFVSTSTARTALGLTDSNATRQLLGVEIGVNVEAWSRNLDYLAAADSGLGGASGFYYYDGGTSEPTTLKAVDARTALELGTSATVDSTTSGEASKIVKTNANTSVTVPAAPNAITANASTLNQLFTRQTGNTTTGTFAVFMVVITGVSGGNYVYGLKEIHSASWGGA